MPFRWLSEQPGETEQDRVARYNALVGLIREAVQPLQNDVTKLDAKVQQVVNDHVTKAEMDQLRAELRAAQSNTYTKEMLDQKLGWLDTRVIKLENGLATTLTRAAAIASIAWVALNALGIHMHF